MLSAGRQGGSSLIEVLVAMLLLSFGMLSLAGLGARSMQHSRVAQYRATAAQVAADYAERLRANRAGVTAGAYTHLAYEAAADPQPLAACAAPTCTAAEMAGQDVALALNAARASLPAGGLLARRDAAHPEVMDVWVLWQPAQAASPGSTGTSLRNHCPPEVDSEPDALQCLHVRVSP